MFSVVTQLHDLARALDTIERAGKVLEQSSDAILAVLGDREQCYILHHESAYRALVIRLYNALGTGCAELIDTTSSLDIPVCMDVGQVDNEHVASVGVADGAA